MERPLEQRAFLRAAVALALGTVAGALSRTIPAEAGSANPNATALLPCGKAVNPDFVNKCLLAALRRRGDDVGQYIPADLTCEACGAIIASTATGVGDAAPTTAPSIDEGFGPGIRGVAPRVIKLPVDP